MNLSHWITAQIISFFVDLELKAKGECKVNMFSFNGFCLRLTKK